MKKLMKFFWISVFVITIILLNINGIIASERPLRTTTVWSDVKGEAQPHIAESWKVSDDGLTWTFYIRKGVKFHDGSELTASDVKYSFDRFRTIGRGNAFLLLGQEMSAEVIDTYTIDFHLEKPMGPFLSILVYFYIVNEDLLRANTEEDGEYGEFGDYGRRYLLTHDAGSGPYMVEDVEVGSSITMVANPYYWIPMDPNAPDEFKMIGTVEAVTVRTLLSNRALEIGDQNQSLENLEALKNIEGVEIAHYDFSAQWDYMICTRKPPTDDIHFRKAMAWATDYDTVINQILVGSTQAKGPVPQVLASHNPAVFQYHRDLDKAMEELKQSKYYGQLEEYPIDVIWCAEVPDEEKMALLFMSNMADVGIKVNIVKTPWSALTNQLASLETSPHIAITYPQARYAEAGAVLDVRYTSKSVTSYSQNEWLLDPEYDAMVEDAIQTIDKDERYAKYDKLQQYIVDLCPTIFVCDYVNKRPFQSDYVDWYVAANEPFSPVAGYDFIIRNIKIYPEKRAELLK